MNRFFALYASLALVGGCQSALHSWSDTATTPAPADQSTIKQTPPAAPFSQQTLYDLLTAEIAGQRNHYDIALENYSAQAKATGDPGVAKRAYQIAEYLNEQPASLNNALLWAKVAPDDIDAQRVAKRDLIVCGNAVIDGDDQLYAARMQQAHRIGRHTVAFAVTVRDVVFHACAHLLQALNKHRGGTNSVRIIVAKDADVFPRVNRAANTIGCLLHIRQ